MVVGSPPITRTVSEFASPEMMFAVAPWPKIFSMKLLRPCESRSCCCVYVVRADRGAHELLEQIVVLIRAPQGRDTCNCLAAERCLDITELFRNKGYCFFPGCLGKCPILLDKRSGKSILAVDKLVAKSPAGTEHAIVHSRTELWYHPHDNIIAHLGHNRAADSAVRTYGLVLLLHLPGR